MEPSQSSSVGSGLADAAKARRVEKLVPVTKMVPACTTQVWFGVFGCLVWGNGLFVCSFVRGSGRGDGSEGQLADDGSVLFL